MIQKNRRLILVQIRGEEDGNKWEIQPDDRVVVNILKPRRHWCELTRDPDDTVAVMRRKTETSLGWTK